MPITEDFLSRTLGEAVGLDARLVLIELDTPGGLVTTVRAMVNDILQCPVPVVVYVSPSGASAASGGVFLILAADVAAMAPVSDMGAAHPVFVTGRNDSENVLLTKAENELAAFARSLAEHRHRNPEAAEGMVRKSLSYSSQEALKAGFIEHEAPDRSELLGWLDGRTIRRYDGTETRLDLAGAAWSTVEMNTRERLLTALSDPMIAFFLLAAGLLGLYIEITHPGAILPAVVGVVCLLLFALSSQVLPVNWIGAGLIGLGLGLLLLEVKVVSYGALSATGLACLVIGGLVLFHAPAEFQVPRRILVSVTLAMGLIALFLVRLAVHSQTRPHATGREALVGMVGEAVTDLDPAGGGEGKVMVRGEYYDVRVDEGVARGDSIRVLSLEGRRLRVEPTDPRNGGAE
ncbi:MAG: nodulation protein NfeD [Acidobacteriota bacterium]